MPNVIKNSLEFLVVSSYKRMQNLSKYFKKPLSERKDFSSKVIETGIQFPSYMKSMFLGTAYLKSEFQEHRERLSSKASLEVLYRCISVISLQYQLMFLKIKWLVL